MQSKSLSKTASVHADAGIRIFCTEERSQGKNKEKAFALLRSRLFELELEKQRSEVAAKRKSQARGCLGAAAFGPLCEWCMLVIVVSADFSRPS